MTVVGRVLVWRYFAVSFTRRLRKATGPWSPWKRMGPLGASLESISPPVGLGASTLAWISLPLSLTLTNLALVVFAPLASNLGAWKAMSRVCHSPAGLGS